jgi:hypothetical protein
MVDSYDNWPEERAERRSTRRSEPRLEQRLDQWVSAGKQLVDGVSGARPGSRPAGRGSGMRLDHLGRWVEDKLDWLMDDDETWRESWEPSAPVAEPSRRRRQPLEAVSRRVRQQTPPPAADAQDWPEDDSFSVNRWQRRAGRQAPEPESDAPRFQSGRQVPRSSRRRAFD